MRPVLSPGQRNRSRLLLAFLSGTLAAATGAGTVAATAAVAQETAKERAAEDLATAAADAEAARAHQETLSQWAAENPVVVTVPRPERTVVGPEVLAGASSSGNAAVGGATAANGAPSRPQPPPPAPPARSTGS